ncbi:MAG: Stp1/IreP family PP2C-type Ser/Thr phosphatase [Nitrospiraceae bacterium]|nr:Stp1/IreP family PP2C-type Ser/Thr phosphatase [Nitrospiraceae bacterium]
MNIIAHGKTDKGLKRSRNEDSFIVDSEHNLFIVADGMGGHASGDVASSLAVETTRDFVKKALADSEITWPFGINQSLDREINILSSGMKLANRYIYNESKGMGTTMVTMLISGSKAYICYIGDSRVYRIRNGKIEQITEDHSLLAEEIKRGTITQEEAKTNSLRHVITRAIGVGTEIQCDCAVNDIISGDTFLLCSDGLSGKLEDHEMLDIITKNRELDYACDTLISGANRNGGDDNITAILVRCN